MSGRIGLDRVVGAGLTAALANTTYLAPILVAPPTGVAATDTASINAAIALLNTAGKGRLVFSPGTYVVNATIVFGAVGTPLDGVLIDGAGATVRLLAGTTVTDVVSLAYCTRLTLRDLAVQGVAGGAGGLTANSAAIHVQASSADVVIDACHVRDFYSAWSIDHSGNGLAVVTNCTVRNYGDGGILQTNAAGTGLIAHNFVKGPQKAAAANGGMSVAGLYTVVASNNVEGPPQSVSVSVSGQYNTVIGNTVYGTGTNFSSNGIYVTGGDCVVVGNFIRNIHQSIVLIGAGNVVNSNKILGRGAGSGNGIVLAIGSTPATDSTVTGNVIAACSIGITGSGQAVARTTVTGNIVLSTVTTPLNNTGWASTCRVTGNAGINPLGPLTAPAVPASTVAATNTFNTDVVVYVSAGTVTSIAVGGTATGMIAGSVRVPAGSTIAVTYTIAPTWTWFGD